MICTYLRISSFCFCVTLCLLVLQCMKQLCLFEPKNHAIATAGDDVVIGRISTLH
jgi:hypothetical protein